MGAPPDALGHLTGVHMPRPSGTQTRTFHYSGAQLTSTVLPENGTTTYVYNSDKTLQAKLDAKGQKVEYSYDAWKRVTQVGRATSRSSRCTATTPAARPRRSGCA
jgi:YD repeat-containing protein